MANLWAGTVNTNGAYKKVSDLTGITFEDGKQYTFQIQNGATVINSATAPTKGGFYIGNADINLFTKVTGEDWYIKTSAFDAVLNIAE